MDANRWTLIKELYERALDLSPDERSTFLHNRCEDVGVREEVASLLAAREEAPGFFDAAAREVVDPALDAIGNGGTKSGEAPDLAGQTVEGYRLTEEIGVGGMSVVYRAERIEADFEQTVAVKFLQRRLHATEAASRFRAERQVLARLDHPNIARLIDGGVADGGRPYLVMEHVEGMPITEYAEAHDLDLDERLDLLRQVFDVVEAAHRQLVVHRDVKPSNVLVAETEDGPLVKLLDFGIAKLLDDSMSVTRVQTRTGQQLMTPAYAAPEQVSGDEVTTATDVYQLGVLAYELLSGARPFDLTDKSLTEIERILLEETPKKPSERGGAEAVQLRGDLDTIVLNALRKEAERRYSSVEALASDLKRYRRGEPIDARPATFGYRAKKFVHRNRTTVAAGVVILLLGVAYAVTVTIQADRLAEQRDRAQREAETTETVTTYLVNLFQAGNPVASSANDLSAEDLVERGVDRAEQLSNRPRVQGEMLSALGQAAKGLGQWNRADSLLQRSLTLRREHRETPHADLVASLFQLGSLHREETDYGRALRFYEDALALSRQLGEKQYRLDLLAGLAESLAETGSPDSAVVLKRREIERRLRGGGEDDPGVVIARMELARILQADGRHAEAKILFNKGLKQIRTDTSAYSLTRRAVAHADFARLLNRNGDHEEAERYARHGLALNTRAHGATHYTTRRTRTHLYAALVQQGKYEQARRVRQTQLKLMQKKYDPPHYQLAMQNVILGRFLDNIGESKQALPHLQRGLNMMRNYAGPDNLWTHNVRLPYALCLVEHGRFKEAEHILDRVKPVIEGTNPDSTTLSIPRMRATLAVARGRLYARRSRWSQADSLLTRGYKLWRTETDRRAPLAQRALRHLATVHERSNQPTIAASYRDSLVAGMDSFSGT